MRPRCRHEHLELADRCFVDVVAIPPFVDLGIIGEDGGHLSAVARPKVGNKRGLEVRLMGRFRNLDGHVLAEAEEGGIRDCFAERESLGVREARGEAKADENQCRNEPSSQALVTSFVIKPLTHLSEHVVSRRDVASTAGTEMRLHD